MVIVIIHITVYITLNEHIEIFKDPSCPWDPVSLGLLGAHVVQV